MLVDLTPARLDLELYAGDGTALTVRCWADAAKTTPLDLSDRSWTAQWRARRNSATDVDLDVDETDSATGVLVVHFAAAATAGFDAVGVWDLQGTAGGSPDTILTGTVVTGMDVTRP